MEAARWVDVSYNTYKKWAKYYGIFEQHLNQEGFGVKKGWATYKVPIDDVITGKRQPPKRWSHKVFKQRLIEEGYFQEECGKCGYNESNILTNKVCLAIDFEDGNHQNFKIENIKLIPGSYDVIISKKNLAKFTNNNYNLDYFIALEPDSTYEE